MGIGDEYHDATKHIRGKRHDHYWDYNNPPSIFKSYEKAVSKIKLPEPVREGGKPLFEVLNTRRSKRDYTGEPVEISQLGQLLWATQGISAYMGDYPLRTAPSAGALYPIETYLVINNVSSIEKGVYHYNIIEHLLEGLKIGDHSQSIARAALNQSFLSNAAVVFVWTAVLERTKWKYGERGYRYIYKDAAHVCANLYLASTSMDLGCCAIGACYDDEVNEIVGVDGSTETVIYLAGVGRVRASD